MIQLLPKWALTNTSPSFYDYENGSILEQTAKIHGKMNELIKDYNKFIDDINKSIEEFNSDTTNNIECFKENIIKIVEDYIKTIDLIMSKQNLEINNAKDYMKENIVDTTTNIINEAIENGLITAGLNATYNSNTEGLTLSVVQNGGEN